MAYVQGARHRGRRGVDDEALREARTGLYSPRAPEPLPAGLAGRYFESAGAQFAFHPELRHRVIFGRHDITRDAPISRLDLLVCRNTLMYFNVEAQSQIIDRFHFALRPGGYLFLGKAEMLLSASDRFEVASMRQRIFRRGPGDAIAPSQLASPRADSEPGEEVREASRKRQLRDLLLDTSASPVLAIGADGTVSVINIRRGPSSASARTTSAVRCMISRSPTARSSSDR